MKLEVDGVAYECRKPVLRLEREVRKLWGQYVELVDEEGKFEEAMKFWGEIVKKIFVSPPAEFVSGEALTQGEMADIAVGFFKAASEMKLKIG